MILIQLRGQGWLVVLTLFDGTSGPVFWKPMGAKLDSHFRRVSAAGSEVDDGGNARFFPPPFTATPSTADLDQARPRVARRG